MPIGRSRPRPRQSRKSGLPRPSPVKRQAKDRRPKRRRDKRSEPPSYMMAFDHLHPLLSSK